jgi:hypothetical protein
MPVLVTGAHQLLARRCVLRLLEEGGEVRAYGSGDLSMLRAAGAMVASGTEDDEGRMEAALADVHTIVHVGAGVLTTRIEAADRAVRTLLTAASNAGVSRVICLSLPGASVDANDPLRRHKGAMETAMAHAPLPTIMLRTSLVDTPAVRDAVVTALPAEVRDTMVAPVRIADLLELIVAFDAARSRATTGQLIVAVDGPQRMTLGDYLAASGGAAGTDHAAAPISRVGRQVASPAAAAALHAALGGPWWSDDPALADGWTFAHLTPRIPGVHDPDVATPVGTDR